MATGGAQKVLLDQAKWFQNHGHQVTVAFFYDRDNLHTKWQDMFPFPIINLTAFRKGQGIFENGLLILNGLWKLWKLLRCNNFDVIETFTHDSNTLAIPLAWMAHVPVRIATHHGIVEGIRPWREKLHTWIINHNLAQHIVAVSSMTREKLLEEGIQAQRIVVIPNGITPVQLEGINKSEVRKTVGVEATDFFLLAVGRLVYSKAHEILISAIPIVLQKFPNTKVGICGDGILRTKLEQQIQKLGLSNSVKLLGQTDHVAKFLAGADMFVMPSLWEGLPIALLEAMSAGLPVVATKVEGVEEAVIEGKHGLLVPTGNVEALATAILKLLSEPQLCAKMGEEAQAKVLTYYTVDKMCKSYLKLILEQYKSSQE
jgi:glycosyltransferase involved in cell wall biosynthesis